MNRAGFNRNYIFRIGWFVAFMLLVMTYWWVMTNFVIPDFWDPQFGLKRDYLLARLKENPGHPLWLVMGSSRVESDLRLVQVLDRMQKKNAPLIFDFGLSGSDLFRQYICLQRLMKDGPKPQLVGIEISGPLLHNEESYFVNSPNLVVRARRDEIDEYCSFSKQPALTRSIWERSRIDPTYKYGMKLPHQTRAFRLIPFPLVWRLEKHFYDKWGWVTVPPAPISKEEYDRGFKITKSYFGNLPADFKVSRNNERALRGILDLCKKSQVRVFLVQMPDSRDLQALYTSQQSARIALFLQQIQKDYDVPIIDASSWLTDPADFTDGSHLNATGVAKFTPRFVDEILKFSK